MSEYISLRCAKSGEGNVEILFKRPQTHGRHRKDIMLLDAARRIQPIPSVREDALLAPHVPGDMVFAFVHCTFISDCRWCVCTVETVRVGLEQYQVCACTCTTRGRCVSCVHTGSGRVGGGGDAISVCLSVYSRWKMAQSQHPQGSVCLAFLL